MSEFANLIPASMVGDECIAVSDEDIQTERSTLLEKNGRVRTKPRSRTAASKLKQTQAHASMTKCIANSLEVREYKGSLSMPMLATLLHAPQVTRR